MVNLVTHIAFWKKREARTTPEPERIIPLPNLSGPSLETPPTTSIETVNKAREALKVLKLERQILGSAVTTIYESHSKGVISEVERDRMLEKYKVDLKRLEKGIQENQQVVDLHDLEIEREELIKGFKKKLVDLDAKLRELKSGSPVQRPDKKPDNEVSDGRGGNDGPTSQDQGTKSDTDQQDVVESENRIEQIREEILKAMDRLEQIETEG